METLYKRFGACGRTARHELCTVAYLGHEQDELTHESRTVRWQCSCLCHRTGLVASAQGDFFAPPPPSGVAAARPAQQGSLFGSKRK